MDTEERKLEKLLKLIELTDNDYVSAEEIASILETLVSYIKSAGEENESKIETLATEISNRLEEIVLTGKENNLKSEQLVNEAKQATLSEIKILTRQLNDEIKRVQNLIPRLPDLSFLERRINEVERKIPVVPKVEEITPEQVRDKLESLTNDERLDVSAIKGIEDLIKQFANTLGIGKVFAAGVNLFSHLNDTPGSYAGQAGKVLAVNSAENGVEFIDNTGGGGGGSNISLSVIPSGTVNGVTLVFTIPAEASQLAVYADGARAIPTDDYSFVAGAGITTITFVSGRQPFSSILVDYTV